MEGEISEARVRFKRRKANNAKRIRHEAEPAFASESQSPDAVTPADADAAALPGTPKDDDDETASSLREALRLRKRPRDRLREAARRAEEATRTELQVQTDAPKQDVYRSRFVAQTGQNLGLEDKQLDVYVEASMAEKNNRLYGWPIPKHLEVVAARIRADLENGTSLAVSKPRASAITPEVTKDGLTGEGRVTDDRHAAGMGRLHEVDLGPDATARNIQRTEEAWKRLEGGQVGSLEDTSKVRLGRDGKPRRRQRRTSEDIRRDQLVEAVLSEAKLGYFGEERQPSPTADNDADNDEAMAEKFRQEFLESIESQKQRRPAPPPGAKGAKEAPKGPKLGGSRSARAAMRLQEEQAAKSKR